MKRHHLAELCVALLVLLVGGASIAALTSNDSTKADDNLVTVEPTTTTIDPAALDAYAAAVNGAQLQQYADAVTAAQIVAYSQAVEAARAAEAAKPKPAPTPKPAAPAPRASAPNTASTGTSWDRVAQCESGGNWSINSGNGYYGGLQMLQSTWVSFGGTEFAARADLASASQQIIVAERIKAQVGMRAWPVCGYR